MVIRVHNKYVNTVKVFYILFAHKLCVYMRDKKISVAIHILLKLPRMTLKLPHNTKIGHVCIKFTMMSYWHKSEQAPH